MRTFKVHWHDHSCHIGAMHLIPEILEIKRAILLTAPCGLWQRSYTMRIILLTEKYFFIAIHHHAPSLGLCNCGAQIHHMWSQLLPLRFHFGPL